MALPRYDAIRLEQLENSWPRVTFDIKLGRQERAFDADAQEYANYLASRNVAAEDIPGFAMHIKAARRFRLTHGHTDPVTNELYINVAKRTSEEQINKTVYHETEHAILRVTGQEPPEWTTRATTAGAATVMTGAVSAYAVEHHAELAAIGCGVVTVALLGAAAASTVLAFQNPREKIPREAEARYVTPLVTVAPLAA